MPAAGVSAHRPLSRADALCAPPDERLVLAFFYSWYGPETFDRGETADRPTVSYISDHPHVMERQVRWAKEAGVDAFISSWTGRGSETDRNLAPLLGAALAQDFRVTVYFETNFAMQRGDVAGQLGDLLAGYATHPAFLHWNGKPVLFFWRPDALGGAESWREVRRQVDPDHEQIWSVDTTDLSYLDVFDTIHFFSGGKWNADTDMARVNAEWRGYVQAYNRSHGTDRLWVAGVIPGWDESRIQPPRDPAKVIPRREGAAYAETWQAAIASDPAWITITSFNEWFEGSQIEPSIAYGGAYLDLTRRYVNLWKNEPSAGGASFPQTGHAICRAMFGYWQANGGLARIGYPVSPWLEEVSPADGRRYVVQYFDHARLELPADESAGTREVARGLLGRELRPEDPPARPLEDGDHVYVAETGHNVNASFHDYWQRHGGLAIFGYPVSEPQPERLADGNIYLVQYFERARLELYLDKELNRRVLTGKLGREVWQRRAEEVNAELAGWTPPPTPTPAPWTPANVRFFTSADQGCSARAQSKFKYPQMVYAQVAMDEAPPGGKVEVTWRGGKNGYTQSDVQVAARPIKPACFDGFSLEPKRYGIGPGSYEVTLRIDGITYQTLRVAVDK